MNNLISSAPAAAAAAAAALPDPQPLGVRIPRLAASSADGRRPNFIVILTGETHSSQQLAVGNDSQQLSRSAASHPAVSWLRCYMECWLLQMVLLQCCSKQVSSTTGSSYMTPEAN
jgi:hypothetical protein